MLQRRRIALLVLPAVAALAGPAATASAGTDVGVRIKNIDFHRAKLHIATGTTVTWSWLDDQVPHNVTSFGKTRFKSSGTRHLGDTYAYTFATPGVYHYHCTIHANMIGKITVA
ncbi:MAG: hypothetical protein QOF76_1058 [Solirubrobacteraceae bacterium]|jgi:plastocyanin|nr:hypothetical protein [Solirubrobacteraceae bacterium]